MPVGQYTVKAIKMESPDDEHNEEWYDCPESPEGMEVEERGQPQ